QKLSGVSPCGERAFVIFPCIVKSSRVHIDHDKDIFDGLDKILAFSDKNKHEYFLYIKAYWLSLYFCEISQKVRERDKLSFYYDEFSVRFPNVVLYPTYFQLHGLASEKSLLIRDA
ncbi:TPA: hypothetical protein GGB83_18380, partial [Escherichia coli]|nr:hypothetical protein [Escherichia coli]